MNKKTLILIIIATILIAIVGIYYFYQKNQQLNSNIIFQTNESSPSRPAEVNGFILSAIGNEIKVAKEIGKPILTEEEAEAKKTTMQNLSPEEKAIAKAEELGSLETEEISLLVPVGVTISKGSGDASGNIINADIAELQKGIYVSVWINEKNEIEYIKIKGS